MLGTTNPNAQVDLRKVIHTAELTVRVDDAERATQEATRLVAGATAVYGEQEFVSSYGEVLAVLEERVVVADNGSTDGSLEWLRETHPYVRSISFGRNLGFAAGYNRALAQVDQWLAMMRDAFTANYDRLDRVLAEMGPAKPRSNKPKEK